MYSVQILKRDPHPPSPLPPPQPYVEKKPKFGISTSYKSVLKCTENLLWVTERIRRLFQDDLTCMLNAINIYQCMSVNFDSNNNCTFTIVLKENSSTSALLPPAKAALNAASAAAAEGR